MSRRYLVPLILVIFLLLFAFNCGKAPLEPFPAKEGEIVPWQRITGKIAYSRYDVNDGGHLFILNSQTKRVELVDSHSDIMYLNLAWSYNGSRIIYSDFDENNRYQLYSINKNGSDRSKIYSVDAHNNYPACYSDERLAYWYNGTNQVNGKIQLRVIWIDGAPFFDKATCDHTRPAWSPDGNFLVVSMQDSTSQGALYKVSLSDTSFTPLLQSPGLRSDGNQEIYHCPIYSPDGSKIAFVKWGPCLDQLSEIWVMNSEGSDPTRLTSGQKDWNPAWSPDGSMIAFSRNYGTLARIHIMNSDGSDVVQITQNVGQNVTWSE